MTRRKRRKFTAEQKAEAVRLVQTSGQSVYQLARDLDLTETALRRWVQQAQIDLETPSRKESARSGTPSAWEP